jgi:hypothetical protein
MLSGVEELANHTRFPAAMNQKMTATHFLKWA